MKKPFTLSVRAKHFTILSLLLIIGTFSICTIKKGHNWGDDFALYIKHASNIVHGDPYGETGSIIHEYAGTYSPQNYPPGFPILLAPVYAFFGLNFIAMKVYMVLWLVLFLGLIWIYFKDKLYFHWNLIIIIIIGLSPFFREMKESVVSDLPAGCFILLTLIIDEKRRLAPERRKYLYLLSIVIWFGAAIRVAGILILPAILMYELIKFRKFKKLSWSMALIVAGLFGLQWLVFPANNYMNIIASPFMHLTGGEILNGIFDRATNYLSAFSGVTHIAFLTPGNSDLNHLVHWFFHVTAAVGFYLKVRNKFSPADLFVVFYLLLIFIFPGYQGTRYLIPVIPFYFFYSMYCLQKIQFKWISASAISIVLILLFFIYNDDHNRMPKDESDGVESQPAQETFQFLKSETPATSVFMSSKPRAFCLFTERKGVVYPDQYSTYRFFEVLDKYHIDYIIRGKYDPAFYVNELEENLSDKFAPVFTNSMFTIYRVN
ncbi:MAG: hypothetical protein ACHQFW_02230 [Chitinophagales bacterium]